MKLVKVIKGYTTKDEYAENLAIFMKAHPDIVILATSQSSTYQPTIDDTYTVLTIFYMNKEARKKK